MIVVADASVAVKWFLADAPDEDHGGPALAIFECAARGSLKPDEAQDDLHDLLSIERRTADRPDIYATATDLAARLRHHLFETLTTRWPCTSPAPCWLPPSAAISTKPGIWARSPGGRTFRLRDAPRVGP